MTRSSMRGSARAGYNRVYTLWVAASAMALVCCGCAKSNAVTGANPEGKDAQFDQSETSITTTFSNGKSLIVVAYNDSTDTDATIQYTQSTRKVLPGASLMGWSYSPDGAKT